jgi:ribosomal protein S18 acetylase RimI-like enzyme
MNNLIFKEIENSYGKESVSFGLFGEDGTQIGKSLCRLDRFSERVWYLSDIEVFSNFRGNRYGSQLLEKTCEALWAKEKLDIVLERPGNSIINGFDRKTWYERHGFTAHPNPEMTYMWRSYQ